MASEPSYCVYYDTQTQEILDFFPGNIDADTKNTVINVWKQEIPKKILLALSEGELTMQELRKKIGHSNSTLHENVKKLEDLHLIRTKLIYEGNKIRILEPTFLFVTQNPKNKTQLKRFFQGLWVNSTVNETVIHFLKKHKDNYYTAEEIAAKTSIPVDEIELALSNWDSKVTRAISDFNKEQPFEKKVLYRGK